MYRHSSRSKLWQWNAISHFLNTDLWNCAWSYICRQKFRNYSMFRNRYKNFQQIYQVFQKNTHHGRDNSSNVSTCNHKHSRRFLELFRNVMAHGDAREGKWRGNCRMEWVVSTLTPPPNVVSPTLLKLMRTPRLPAIDWTEAPTDLNGLVLFGKRRNLVTTRVPSRSARAILP